MAYSNTNKDNIQTKVGKTIKSVILTIILTVVTLSAGINIFNQWTTLRLAMKRNDEMSQKISLLEKEIKDMERQVEYATSSANIERKIREYMGMGTSSDYWILMPTLRFEDKTTTEMTEAEEKPVIIQWRDLFIK